MISAYTLDSGVEAHRAAPDTFMLPPERDRRSLGRGDFAKLMFRISDGDREAVERMWVRVQEVDADGYVGVLDSEPQSTDAIGVGLRVEFSPDHVIQIQRDAS
jgi:uncharacterized protein YegJ (DUF2314 family)